MSGLHGQLLHSSRGMLIGQQNISSMLSGLADACITTYETKVPPVGICIVAFIEGSIILQKEGMQHANDVGCNTLQAHMKQVT